MDRGAWRATVQGVAKSWTGLRRISVRTLGITLYLYHLLVLTLYWFEWRRWTLPVFKSLYLPCLCNWFRVSSACTENHTRVIMLLLQSSNIISKLKKKKSLFYWPMFLLFQSFFPDIPRVLLSFWVGQSQVALAVYPLCSHAGHTPHTSDTRWGVEWTSVSFPSNPLQHQLDVLQFNSVLTLPTWSLRQDSPG